MSCPHGWRDRVDCELCLGSLDRAAELAQRMRDWLAESAVSERITAGRCREFLAICDEYSGGGEHG